MLTNRASWGLILLVALFVIGVAISRPASSPGAGRADVLPAEDAARIQVTVARVPDAAGLISADAALATARAYWVAEPSQARAYLQVLTDAGSARANLTDRPIWILAYDAIDDETPTGRPLNHAYVLVDAVTGELIHVVSVP